MLMVLNYIKIYGPVSFLPEIKSSPYISVAGDPAWLITYLVVYGANVVKGSKGSKKVTK